MVDVLWVLQFLLALGYFAVAAAVAAVVVGSVAWAVWVKRAAKDDNGGYPKVADPAFRDGAGS